MLRFFITERFAPQHSPYREQRLLFVDPPDENSTESLEGSTNGPESTAKAEVQKISHVMSKHLSSVTPELLINEMGGKVDIFDALRESNILTNETEAIMMELRGVGALKETDVFSNDEKERIVTKLLQTTKNTVEVARMVEGELQGYEESLSLLTQELKRIVRHTESTVNDVAHFLSEVHKIREEKGATSETVQNRIAALLGIHPTATFVDEDGKPRNLIIHRILPSIEAIAKYDNRRRSFAKNTTTGGEDGQEAATALDGLQPAEYRERKIARLGEQDRALKEYLESKLQQEGQQVYSSYEQWLKGIEGLTDEETLQTMGVSREGLYHEFCTNVASCTNVFSQNDRNPSRNLVLPENQNYLTCAAAKIEELDSSRAKFELTQIRTSDDSRDVRLPRFVIELRKREEFNEKIAKDIADRIEKLKNVVGTLQIEGSDILLQELQGTGETFAGYQDNPTPSLESRLAMRLMPPQKLVQYLEALKVIEKDPAAHIQKVERKKRQAGTLKKKFETAEATVRSESINTLRKDFEHVHDNLPQLLTHPIFQATKAYQYLRFRFQELRITLNKEKITKEKYAAAALEVRELGKGLTMLKDLQSNVSVVYVETKQEFKQYDEDETTLGFYDSETKKIYINEEACGNQARIQATLQHEKGHAIIDILSRQTDIAPNLLAGIYSRLADGAHQQGKDIDTLLQSLGEKWNCPARDRHSILEEAAVRYSDYCNNLSEMRKPTSDELEVFQLLGEQDSFQPSSLVHGEQDGSPPSLVDGERPAAPTKARKAAREGDEEETAQEEVSARSKLQELQKKLSKIKNFLEVYPEYKNVPAFSIDKINAIEKSLREAEDAFEKGEEETRVLEILASGDNIADNIAKIIEGIDAEKKDLTYAEPSTKSTWRQSLFNGVAWMSISDVMTLFKESSEDVQRMWKRRGESVRASMGKNLFGLIPESVPYLGQLTKEFRGREQSSEQEEVSVWEKRYTTIDAYTLLNDILPGLTNKDQTKAVVNLLTKKGRMDWNNTNFWDVLERLSIYHMPHRACKRDQILRNQYLQKLIANIWDDKDLFEQWKNDNDSNINSGKSKLGPTIDELSGTRGALEAKLKELLGKHKKQQAGEYIAKEEEINPHFYEGILLYAMQNGKASMEGKIFYLIQGVANGLISMDRIKGFIGTQGEILNAFPVIDYFNNKTYEEVMEVAKQLGYPAAIEPDERTVDFLLDVLRNDQGAKQRVQKGMSQVQKWDHEDLPMHVSMLDHKAMNDVIAPVSGSTPKVTIEGMKNIYVGFNSALQHFAIKAKLHKDGISQFTNEDARQCMTTIAAYTNFNNRVTIPAAASVRPTLSWNNINNETAVVSGNNLVKNYRDNMNTFIFGLTTGGEEGKPNLGIPQARDIDMRTFLGIGRNAENTSSDIYTEKKYDGAANVLDSTLQAAAVSKKNILIDALALMAVKQPSAGGFIPENDAYTYEKIRALTLKRKKAASGGAQVAA